MFGDRLNSILTGTILGDAYLQSTGRQNARLRLEHSLTQESYLLWKMRELEKAFQGKLTYLSRKHPQTRQIYHYVRYQTYAYADLGILRKMFYPEGKKQIPECLEEIINPLVLAVWYMDDGYYDSRHNSAYLYFGTITQLEAEIAQHAIQSKLKIDCKVKNLKKKGLALYFSPRKTRKLKDEIKNYILPFFAYKLSLDPVTTEGFKPEIGCPEPQCSNL
jgi:LAGLIDADG DNA endonuclease family